MTSSQQPGRAWVFGDDIDTDVLAPGLYMKGPIETLAAHCLETVDPSFATSVQSGDIIIAGKNFGIGSSREQAAQVLKSLGIAAIAARSFGGIFYRNALNFGLTAVVSDDVSRVRSGEQVLVDAVSGTIKNLTTGTKHTCKPIPAHLMEMVNAGGLVAHLKQNRPRTIRGNAT